MVGYLFAHLHLPPRSSPLGGGLAHFLAVLGDPVPGNRISPMLIRPARVGPRHRQPGLAIPGKRAQPEQGISFIRTPLFASLKELSAEGQN
jgi:hypothetical protein